LNRRPTRENGEGATPWEEKGNFKKPAHAKWGKERAKGAQIPWSASRENLDEEKKGAAKESNTGPIREA